MRLFRARREARLLARDIVEKLVSGSYTLIGSSLTLDVRSDGKVSVALYYGAYFALVFRGADLWFPLLAKLRVHRAVRYAVAKEARAALR